MATVATQIRRNRRSVALVEMIAWLPFVSTFCIEVPHANAARDAHGQVPRLYRCLHSHERAQNPAPATEATHHDQHRGEPPHHVCCDMTGKRTTALPEVTAPLVPIVFDLALTLPPPSTAVDAEPKARRAHPAHGPPPYLRHSVLLI